MTDKNPIEYSRNVLNQRNELTGPSDAEGKNGYPKPPKHVPIQKQSRNREE